MVTVSLILIAVTVETESKSIISLDIFSEIYTR